MYKRLSPVVIQNGTKRPEVIMLQDALKAVGFKNVGASDGWAGTRTEDAIRRFQKAEFGDHDGKVGRHTWTQLLSKAEEAGWKPPLERRMHSVICFYENSIRQNAYGSTSLLPDGAGVNYGVLQHNRHGSLSHLLKLAGRIDLANEYNSGDKFKRNNKIAYWMQSPDGVEAQNNYFDKVIMKYALNIASEMQGITDFFAQPHNRPFYERYILMLTDTVVQNGGMWSPTKKPFWKSLTKSEANFRKYRELYYGNRFDKFRIVLSPNDVDEHRKRLSLDKFEYLTYENFKKYWYSVEGEVKSNSGSASDRYIRRKTNHDAMVGLLKQIPDPEHKLILIAQWRSRSSASKWWTPAVESRRMLDAIGVSVVNGSRLNLENDFCFMDDDLMKKEKLFEAKVDKAAETLELK